jgi:hypothetical protein
MALIMTTCPTTGRHVSTSQHVMSDAFEETQFPSSAFRCSACNQVHTWTKEEAWISLPRLAAGPKLAADAGETE